ncbi:3-isopropylmalate dehydrogenase [Ekhidna sp.]|jgi:3-isopropylmalate dehydrogenase|uniref:3-isopropylmalate dehydrogenase n=1 Tax=Ekhidna sp. TaxID=2608089 RepID=UPI0032EFA761
MKKNITILPGDGIGPEVVSQATKVMHAINAYFGHDFILKHGLIGANAIEETGSPLPDETLDLCLNSDAILLGSIGDPKYDNDPNLKVRPEQGLLKLRKSLQLFSNIRPVKTYDILKGVSPLKEQLLENVDMVIYRELTGGIYFGDKVLSDDGSHAHDSCDYTTHEISRIAYQAFEAATLRRKKLTLIDKANVLETSRLWRRVIQDISKEYPGVEVEYMYVDNAAMQMMLNPGNFDVVLTENMFGDIISDLSSVITGSLGMLPSSSVGTKSALFEPIHGSYPQASGKDIANPMATILSVAMMYEHFELYEEAKTIRKAVDWALEHKLATEDILKDKNEASPCSKVGDSIAWFIEEGGKMEMNKDSINLSLNCII